MDQDFPVDLRPKDKVRRPYFNMKKQGPIKYGTDQENKVRKFFMYTCISEVNQAHGKRTTFKFSGLHSKIWPA